MKKKKKSFFILSLTIIFFILFIIIPLIYTKFCNNINKNSEIIKNSKIKKFISINLEKNNNFISNNLNNYKYIELLEQIPSNIDLKNNKYSIIIPTHSERQKILSSILHNFLESETQYLEEIFIYWCDRNKSIQIPTLSSYNITNNTKIKIAIIESKNRLITDRFLIPSTIKTSYILSMDDDLFVNPLKVDKLFDYILKHNITKQIVGPTSRSFINNSYLNFYQKNYSMILTNFAFLHIEMLQLFNQPQYKKHVKYVAQQMDGEDILMNYIVTSVFKLPPIQAHLKINHYSEKGISTNEEHNNKRNECCRLFNEFFGNGTLIFSTKRIIF